MIMEMVHWEKKWQHCKASFSRIKWITVMLPPLPVEIWRRVFDLADCGLRECFGTLQLISKTFWRLLQNAGAWPQRVRIVGHENMPKPSAWKALRRLDLRLEELILEGDIEDQDLSGLRGLYVKSLVVSNMARLSDIGLHHIGALRRLRSLGIRACPLVTLTGLGLSGFNHLRCLMLERLIGVCDRGLSTLMFLPIRRLRIVSCRNLTPAGFIGLTDLKLTHLTLDLPHGQSPALVTCFNPTFIKYLSLRFHPSFDLSHLLKFFAHSPLIEVHLHNAPLQYRAFKDFHTSSLKRLDISHSSVKDEDLKDLAKVGLQLLCMEACSTITDAGLWNLKGSGLISLDLTNNPQLTNQGLLGLRGLPLRDIWLYGCSGVNFNTTQVRRMFERIKFVQLVPFRHPDRVKEAAPEPTAGPPSLATPGAL